MLEASSLIPFWLGALIVFVYGTAIGSFLNVVIYRMPLDLSIVRPPSHCPKCNTRLRAIDLIPLLSFLVLGRKCRYCGEPIGWRYFGVELLTGLALLALYAKFGFEINFFVFALFTSALIAVVFIDLDHWIIPDQINLFGVILGVGRDILGFLLHEEGHVFLRIPIPATEISVPMLWSVVGLLICGGIFYFIAVVGGLVFKKDAMGGGDIKLAAAIGAVMCGSITSWFGLGLALLSFFLAVFVGSIIGIGMKIAGASSGKENYLPFGPMMVIGVFATWFVGQPMIKWYLGFLQRGGM